MWGVSPRSISRECSATSISAFGFAKRGGAPGWTPHAELLHYEHPADSRGTDGANAVRFDRDIRYLQRRWGKCIENDPSYNPNLSLAHESLSLAWPPRRPFG